MTAALMVDAVAWVVNVGDSRTLVIDSEKSMQLTRDATPELSKDRVEQEGGCVVDGRVPRKGEKRGGLATASSIGEEGYAGITERAEVSKYILTGGETLVLHCDGVSDSLSTKEVGAVLNNPNFETPEKKSAALVKTAFAGGSLDNISALVIRSALAT